MVFRASTMPFSTSEGSATAAAVASGAWGWVAVSCSGFIFLLLRGDGLILRVERGHEGVPGEGGALDPHRVFADAGEDGQLAEVLPLLLSLGDQLVETVEEAARLREAAAFQRLGHQRRGGGRNGASGPFERDAADAVLLDVHVDGHPVAAERVVPLRPAVGLRQRPEVAGPPVVVEDDLLVEVAQVAHPNSSRALWRAAARASTSSGVL